MSTQRCFEEFIRNQVPDADLTKAENDEGQYANEGIHAAWIGFQALTRSSLQNTTNCSEVNCESEDGS